VRSWYATEVRFFACCGALCIFTTVIAGRRSRTIEFLRDRNV